MDSLTNSSYVTIAQQDKVPDRDQGLIMHYVEGLNLTDYTSAIGDLVKSENIVGASKISYNRVCLYTSSKELVEKIKYKN